MRETTIRRTLVFVLCALGVVGLWVVNDQLRADRNAEPSVPAASQSSANPWSSKDRSPSDDRKDASRSVSPAKQQVPGDQTRQDQHQPHPTATGDTTPPGQVRGTHLIQNSHDSVTIGWRRVPDRSGIAYYEVTLNSIPVGRTGSRELTVDWLNDDMSHHFLQVRAIDGAGNRGERGQPLTVTRPPEPSNSASPPFDSQPGSTRSGSTGADPSPSTTGPDSPDTQSREPVRRPTQQPETTTTPQPPDPTKPAPDPTKPAPDPTKPAPDPTKPAPDPTKPAPGPTRPTDSPSPTPTQTAKPSPTPDPTDEQSSPAPSPSESGEASDDPTEPPGVLPTASPTARASASDSPRPKTTGSASSSASGH